LHNLSAAQESPKQALEWLLKLFKANETINSSGKKISTDVLFNRDDLIFEIIKFSDKSGLAEDVLLWSEKLSPNAKQNPAVLLPQAESLLKLSKIQDAQNLLENEILKEHPRALELRGLILTNKAEFPQAISVYEKLYGMFPDNVGIIKRLAGLYAKTSQQQKAIELIQILNHISDKS